MWPLPPAFGRPVHNPESVQKPKICPSRFAQEQWVTIGRIAKRSWRSKDIMKCVICKKGETKAGTATVTLAKDGATLVFKGVPARVCTICGEEYVDENIVA